MSVNEAVKNTVPNTGEFLWAQTNYLTKEIYRKGYYIREYDISKANITMLRSSGVIDGMKYHELFYMDKYDREAMVGRMIREEKEHSLESPSISRTEEEIKSGILLAKQKFFEANAIQPEEVLRIANDSVLVCRPTQITQNCFILNEDRGNKLPTVFTLKAEYTLFIRLAKTVLLINTQTGVIDVKGISDSLLQLHSEFLKKICEILSYKEMGDSKVALMKYHEFYTAYAGRNLDLCYYREFNATSSFRLKTQSDTVAGGYGLMDVADDFDIRKLDISYNLYVLRDLYAILIS